MAGVERSEPPVLRLGAASGRPPATLAAAVSETGLRRFAGTRKIFRTLTFWSPHPGATIGSMALAGWSLDGWHKGVPRGRSDRGRS